MRTRKTHLEFREIADLWAQESPPGHLSRDATLMELLGAVWRGELEEKIGLKFQRLPPGGAKFIAEIFSDEYNASAKKTGFLTFNRGHLLYLISTCDGVNGNPLLSRSELQQLSNSESDNCDLASLSERRPEITWDFFENLNSDDYDEGFLFGWLERLSISQQYFGDWCDHYDHPRPAFWFGDKAVGETIELGAPKIKPEVMPRPEVQAKASPPWWPRTLVTQSKWRRLWGQAIESNSDYANWNVSRVATKLAKMELGVNRNTIDVEKRAPTIRKLLGQMRNHGGPPAKEK